MEPITYLGLLPPCFWHALHASSAICRLNDTVLSPNPYSSSFIRFEPNELVSMQSAPASRYFLWMDSIHSGCVTTSPSLNPSLSSGKSDGCGSYRCISVPMAPSKSSTLFFMASKKGSFAVSGISQAMPDAHHFNHCHRRGRGQGRCSGCVACCHGAFRHRSPHLDITRNSSFLNSTASTARPVAMITSMIAKICDMSLSDRPT